MFNFDNLQNSHMPFIAYGAYPDFTPKAFCCIKVGGKWKLHHYDGEWKRLETGLPEDATECSPTAEWHNGNWRISFIAGGYEADRRFYLYQMRGLDGVPERVSPADIGFVWKNRIVYGGRDGILYIAIGETMQKLTFANVEYLYRVSYNPDCPQELLISGQYKGGEIFSWALNPHAKSQCSLSVDGMPAYKAAFFKGRCFYAKRGENGFEDRRIEEAREVSKNALDFDSIVKIEMVETSSSVIGMLQRFTGATFRWAKAGFTIADDEELASRKSTCTSCPYWKPKARLGMGKCLKCGCTSMKLKFATEKCPIGKW